MPIPTSSRRFLVAALAIFTMVVSAGPASARLFGQHKATATSLSPKIATRVRTTNRRHHRQTATNARTGKRVRVRSSPDPSPRYPAEHAATLELWCDESQLRQLHGFGL